MEKPTIVKLPPPLISPSSDRNNKNNNNDDDDDDDFPDINPYTPTTTTITRTLENTSSVISPMTPPPSSSSHRHHQSIQPLSNVTSTTAAAAAATLSDDVVGTPNINTNTTIDSLDRRENAVATLSNPWESDDTVNRCCQCNTEFHNLNRRHHCRHCGRIFCGQCSSQRSLIPPSAIVLTPRGGKKVRSADRGVGAAGGGGFLRDGEDDPDRMLTFMSTDDNNNNNNNPEMMNGEQILYGQGLEERYKLSREPLRVCDACHIQLEGVQEELRACNSNAVRFNSIDPTDVRRLFNSPVAFTLGHEVRKAAYTLNNLLPLPKRMGAFVNLTHESSTDYSIYNPTSDPSVQQHCKDTCQDIGANFGKLDGVRIPARLLEEAKGVAVMTVVKGGFGLAGFEFGTGLVVARLGEDRGWSAPSAIGTAGVSWGALMGAQVSDHVFLLMTDTAVDMMMSGDGSLQLGADVGVAVGPLGRSLEADFGATGSGGSNGAAFAAAPIYTYSLSKGFYVGVSLDGKVIVTRHRVNEKFYGRNVHPRELLSGEFPTPPAAQPLYDALKRCHQYASGSGGGGGSNNNVSARQMFAADLYAEQFNDVVTYGNSSSGFRTPTPPSPSQQQQQHHQQQQSMDYNHHHSSFTVTSDRSGNYSF